MATREQGSILARQVPFSLSEAESLSWDLGAELAERKPECARLEHAERCREVAVYAATQHTVIARVRTPVGRETFFGLARSAFRDALASLPSDWEVAYADC